MVKTLKKELQGFFRMDAIRLSKFVEIFQFTALSFFLGFFLGSTLNKIMPDLDDDIPTHELLLDILFQLLVLAIALFYSEKILKIIKHHVPVLFSFTKNYIPCARGECSLGVTLGFSLSFMGSMEVFHKKVQLLHERIFRAK
tara:strand:+ start:349 stop:774 length:426 start_codon:yes stop_codon:yes gene_type:complete